MAVADPTISIETDNFGALLGELKAAPQIDHRTLQQQALLAFGRRTNAHPPLPILMQDAATLVGEILNADWGGVGLVEGDTLTMSVTNRRSPSKDPDVHRCPLSESDSMTAHALRSAQLTICDDIGSEARFRDAFLKRLGVVGALVIPLHLYGKAFGALAVYSAARKRFSADDVTFAETIAHLLSASVARIKMEQKMLEAREFQSSILGMVDSLVVTLDLSGSVIDMNPACAQVCEYALDEVCGKPFWESFAARDEAEIVRIIFKSAMSSQLTSEFESLLMAKNGSQRRISWSIKILAAGSNQRVLVTGRDQTSDVATKEELAKVKSLVEQTTTTLAGLCKRLDAPRSEASYAGTLVEPVPPNAGTPTKQVPPVEAVPPVDDEDLDDDEPPLEPTGDAPGNGRRSSPRRAYPYRQAIAPLSEEMSPSPWEFFEVDCWDISADGISFFLDRLPAFDTMVIALGRPPALTHFKARVMRVSRIEKDGKTRFHVGCGFLKRIESSSTLND